MQLEQSIVKRTYRKNIYKQKQLGTISNFTNNSTTKNQQLQILLDYINNNPHTPDEQFICLQKLFIAAINCLTDKPEANTKLNIESEICFAIEYLIANQNECWFFCPQDVTRGAMVVLLALSAKLNYLTNPIATQHIIDVNDKIKLINNVFALCYVEDSKMKDKNYLQLLPPENTLAKICGAFLDGQTSYLNICSVNDTGHIDVAGNGYFYKYNANSKFKVQRKHYQDMFPNQAHKEISLPLPVAGSQPKHKRIPSFIMNLLKLNFNTILQEVFFEIDSFMASLVICFSFNQPSINFIEYAKKVKEFYHDNRINIYAFLAWNKQPKQLIIDVPKTSIRAWQRKEPVKSNILIDHSSTLAYGKEYVIKIHYKLKKDELGQIINIFEIVGEIISKVLSIYADLGCLINICEYENTADGTFVFYKDSEVFLFKENPSLQDGNYLSTRTSSNANKSKEIIIEKLTLAEFFAKFIASLPEKLITIFPVTAFFNEDSLKMPSFGSLNSLLSKRRRNNNR